MGAEEEKRMDSIEEEIGKVVEEAKELQDAAASYMNKSATDEQSLRHRAQSLDSSLRRLRSLLPSLNRLDPKLADKASFHFYLFKRKKKHKKLNLIGLHLHV